MIENGNKLATSIRLIADGTRVGTILPRNRSFTNASWFFLIMKKLAPLHSLTLRKACLFTASTQFTIQNLNEISIDFIFHYSPSSVYLCCTRTDIFIQFTFARTFSMVLCSKRLKSRNRLSGTFTVFKFNDLNEYK